jgi:hypothetical protein
VHPVRVVLRWLLVRRRRAGRPDGATRLELLGLTIGEDDADGELLQQPCAALQGRRCSIYAHRPKCCRSFECRLLQDVRRGAVAVERAAEQITETLEQIRRVKGLLAKMGQRDARLPLNERCAEALAAEGGETREWNQTRAELESAMSAVERSVRETFLGGGGGHPAPARRPMTRPVR